MMIIDSIGLVGEDDAYYSKLLNINDAHLSSSRSNNNCIMT